MYTLFFTHLIEEEMLDNHSGQFRLESNEDIRLLFFDGGALNNEPEFPSIFNLNNPYPNPFNPIVNFDLNVSKTEYFNIDIYDIQGNKIDNIWSGLLNHGVHSFNWDGADQSTGIYIIKCSVNNVVSTQKIFLIK